MRDSKVVEVFGFSDRYLKWIGVFLLSLSIPFVFHDTPHTRSLSEYFKQAGIAFGYTMVLWIIIRELMLRTFSKYEISDDATRIILQVGTGILFFSIVISALGTALEDCMVEKKIGFANLLRTTVLSIIISIAVVSVYISGLLYLKLIASITESERLKRQSIQSQLETLKNQVNPHFLFNSLNTLASIIPEEPDHAVRYTEELSRVYRYILEIKNHQLITLRDEMDCIRAYQFMLETRFGPNVKVNVNIPSDCMNKYIVPLSLQILLENAIKHNVISRDRPLHIDIVAGREYISMTNSYQPKLEVEPSTQTGLENIRSRYALIANQDIDVYQDAEIFRVALPLLSISE